MLRKKIKVELTKQKAKKSRCSIRLDEKLKIIRMYEQGQRVALIAREINRPPSTVATILRDKERIEASVNSTSNLNGLVISKQRAGPIVRMEELLAYWIEDLTLRHQAPSQKTIQQKAASLYLDLIDLEGGPPSIETAFQASNGWFHRFKTRLNHNRVALPRANTGKADKDFIALLNGVITQGGYLPEQIFNVAATPLYWRRIPQRSHVMKDEPTDRFNMSKDRITVAIGSNIPGDFKLTAHVEYHISKLEELRHLSPRELPVVWRCDPREDWITKYFIPEVQQYYARRKLPFKVLLLLDNIMVTKSFNVNDVNLFCPELKIVYFPSSMQKQPLDKMITTLFQRNYFTKVLEQASLKDIDDNIQHQEFMSQYSMLDAVKNIATAWNDISKESLQMSWTKLFPHLTTASAGESVCECELNDYILGPEEDLTNEDLLQFEVFRNSLEHSATSPKIAAKLLDEHTMENSSGDDQDQDERCEDRPQKPPSYLDTDVVLQVVDSPEPASLQDTDALTRDGLSKAVWLVDLAMSQIDAMDPDKRRFRRVSKGVRKALAPYCRILDNLDS